MLLKTKIKNSLSIIISVFFCFITNFSLSYDNSHFYRSHFFDSEPRFERDYLSSFDIYAGGGSTCNSLNSNSQKSCLLDICGCYNMQYLGKNVPEKDLSRTSDIIMQQLEQIPSYDNIGLLSFSGEFKTAEADFSYYQNLKSGIFMQVHLPVRKLQIKNIGYCNASCNTNQNCSLLSCQQNSSNSCSSHNLCSSCAGQNSSANQNSSNTNLTTANSYWQAFLNSFDQVLLDYNLSIADTNSSGIGDLSTVLGYTINYDELDTMDFIDATFKFGVMCPTSKKKNENCVFSLPLGYNGHTGVFGSIDTAFGVYDWITLGLHVDAITFNRICKKMRVKTALEQSGLIKLAETTVREKLGNIYDAMAYFKADHIGAGFSLLAGYTYSTQENSELDCFKNTCIDCQAANSDCSLQRWKMHTIHLLAEYDFSQENRKYCPRINAFYNIIAGGSRIFDTSVGGAGVGLDIAWK